VGVYTQFFFTGNDRFATYDLYNDGLSKSRELNDKKHEIVDNPNKQRQSTQTQLQRNQSQAVAETVAEILNSTTPFHQSNKSNAQLETNSTLAKEIQPPQPILDKKNSNSSFSSLQQQAEHLLPLPIVSKSNKNGKRVGYAISLIKCGDFQSSAAGLIDASLVLRHSVHLTHMQSKYDYKMYAILHRQATKCSKVLEDSGFEIVIADPPVNATDIRGEYLRTHIHKEWCCGAQEFVKLYAYTLPEPVIVHVDIDFAFLRPMDDLFDAIIYDKDSIEGRQARSNLLVERPHEPLPDTIDAFVTRDWPQVMPGRKALYQAGFLVARHDPSVLKDAVDVILEGNYTPGYGRDTGWGSAGYGIAVGAMAMQGLMAYFYDMIRPNTAVELNQCRFNHMGMDVRYRHHPNFRMNKKTYGKCRNNGDYCEDCMVTEIQQIYNVHYTQCRKPWNCIGVGAPDGRYRGKKASAIDTNAGNFTHCMELTSRWHALRSDLENQLYNLTKDETILEGRNANYKLEYFKGHCRDEGGKNYLNFKASDESMKRIADLYK